MPRKPRPKYPNKAARRRLVSQFLLLLAVAGGIGFYYYIHATDPDAGKTLLRLGASIGQVCTDTTGPATNGTIREPSPPPPDPGVVKGEVNRTTIPAPPSSQAAAAASAAIRKRGEQSSSSFSAPVRKETVIVYPMRDPSPAAPASSAGVPGTASPAPTAPAEAFPAAKPSASPGSVNGTAPPLAAPYEGMDLAEVSRKLRRKYGNAPSGKWGEHVAGVTTRLDPAGAASPLTVALTFDACGGGRDGYDADLIAFLREQQIPATLFFTSLWMRRHQDAVRELAADPLFEIAAHGERHRPCSVDGKSAYGIQGTASMEELVREVLSNARELAALTGRYPRWFRSGTAYYDELAVKVIHDLGMNVAGYSIAGDEGATLPAARVAAKTLQAKDGDILLFHMNKPRSGTREGLMRAIPVLRERGAVFVRLSDRR